MPRKKAAPQRNEASAADAKRAREEADKAAADAARKRARSEAFTRSVTKVDAPLVPEKHRDDDGVEVARLNGVRATRGDDASTSSPASVPTRLTLEVAGDGSKVPRLAWSFADEEKDGSPSGDEREWRPERDPSFHAASALLFLIERGRFALRLDARDATRCTLAVLVAPDALESPTHPEDREEGPPRQTESRVGLARAPAPPHARAIRRGHRRRRRRRRRRRSRVAAGPSLAQPPARRVRSRQTPARLPRRLRRLRVHRARADAEAVSAEGRGLDDTPRAGGSPGGVQARRWRRGGRWEDVIVESSPVEPARRRSLRQLEHRSADAR